MKNRQPTLAELMAGAPSSSRNTDEGLEKAAAQAQVGEIFEGLTKEAKDDLIGTMGWAGRVFGEQIAEALSPTVTKLAELVTEMKTASTNLKNEEQTELYRRGHDSGSNPGGLPAKLKNVHTKDCEVNVGPVATPTEKHPEQGSGFKGIQAEKKKLLHATTISEKSKIGSEASAILGNIQKESGKIPPQFLKNIKGKDGDDDENMSPKAHKKHEEEECKKAELQEIGRQFGAMLKADLAQNQ